MRSMRIGGKLGVAFCLLLLLILAVGSLSIYSQGQLDATAQTLGVSKRKKLEAVAMINSAASEYRTAEATQILSDDENGIAAAGADLARAQTAVDNQTKFLRASLHAPLAVAAFKKAAGSWDQFIRQTPTTLAFSHRNEDAPAIASFRSERHAFRQVKTDMTNLAAAESKVMDGDAAEAHAAYLSARNLTVGAILAAMILAGTLLFLLVRAIARPLAAMTKALGDLAKGNMAVDVPVQPRADEIGDLAQVLTSFRDQLASAERAKAEQTALIVDSIGKGLSGLAEGDLVSRIKVELTGPFAKLKTDFNAAAAALQGTMAQMAEAASGINTGAGEIRHASDDLSQRTEQQAASLEETAAAMDEINTTVRQTAERANQANIAVRQARDEAEHSGEVVRSAVEAMGGIERTSNEISEIISVIDGIAFQTNLLALNAGVEAARAGDAGKGFAVVASEVRALAQRSAEAAKDVKTRITASSEQVAAGVQLVGETGQALGRIVERIGMINGLVADIASSAEQQATGLQQVNTAVGEMDGVTQQNAAMVEEATAAARSLAAEADGMSRQIARFRTGDGPAAPASPVHRLQERAASAGRHITRVTSRPGGGKAAAAVVVAEDDWSQF